MVVAAYEAQSASARTRRLPTRAELKRALSELETRLWRDARHLSRVREQGGFTALLERRWLNSLHAYEQLAVYLEQSAR